MHHHTAMITGLAFALLVGGCKQSATQYSYTLITPTDEQYREFKLSVMNDVRELAIMHAAIDQEYLSKVASLYPDTNVGAPTFEQPIVFVSVQCFGTVPVSGTTLHVVGVRRVTTNMRAPRGMNDVLVIDDDSHLIAKEHHTDGAVLDGSLLSVGGWATRVDLANPDELRDWSTGAVALLDADNSVGFWYERINAALMKLHDGDSEAFRQMLEPDWNSRITGIRATRVCDESAIELDSSEFAARFRLTTFDMSKPTLSDVDFNPSPSSPYSDLERPWTGIIRARIIDEHDQEWALRFLLAGARPGT